MNHFCWIFAVLMMVTPHGVDAQEDSATEVETRSVELASQYVRDITGPEFFEQSVKCTDTIVSAEDTNVVHAVYEFSFSSAPGEILTFDVRVDLSDSSTGSMRRIPRCKDNADNCTVRISKDRAVAIAKEHGLEAGIVDWTIELTTIRSSDELLWAIENTTTFEAGPCGRIVLVSAYSGEVIETRDKSKNH